MKFPMLKSLSESLRSLWQPKTDEAVEGQSRKRKRPSDEGAQDDLDVEVVSVKLPKKETQESSLGLLAILTTPMSKMSEWVRKKTVRQDHFFVRPIPPDSHWHDANRREGRRNRGGGEEDGPAYSAGQIDPRNGLKPHHHLKQDDDRLSHPPGHGNRLPHPPAHSDRLPYPHAHGRNGAQENGANGERGAREKDGEAMNGSVTSSRCSSFSSSQPGTERGSSADRCYHLKERADYLKLLQQFTTVDLGYHGSRNKTDQGAADLTSSRRKPGLYLPLPSATPTSSSTARTFTARTDTRPPPHPPARFTVTPSRYVHASSSLFPPSGQTGAEHPPSSSSFSSSAASSLGERYVRPAPRPGRALRVEKAPSSTLTRTPRQAARTPRTSLTPREQVSSWQGKAPSVNSTPHCPAQERLKGAPCFDVNQRLKETLHSDVDQRLKETPDFDRDQSLKGAPHSDGDGRLKGTPDHGDEQLKATAEPDVKARLGDAGETDAVPRTVGDGHDASVIMQSTPGLNFKSSEYLDDDWINKLDQKYAASERERQRLITEAEVKKKLLEERREARLTNLGKKLECQLRLFDEEPEVIEELPLPEVPQEKPLPELTEAMVREVRRALAEGSPSEVLSEGFRLQLTRADIATLRGLNWLNDEVINFYMNLMMERGEQEGFDKTYAFNTFFYPKLLGGGHAAVKRWTRKVDVFSHVYLIIPVHLGVHWCLCMVFVRDKKICYYDSMGGSNNQCLNTVRQYLSEESQQKRNVQLDLSQWTSHIVKDIPLQMNGSDCGMFACMYAETLTRGDNITFTQKDMPYFRKRMVYEILKKKLL